MTSQVDSVVLIGHRQVRTTLTSLAGDDNLAAPASIQVFVVEFCIQAMAVDYKSANFQDNFHK